MSARAYTASKHFFASAFVGRTTLFREWFRFFNAANSD
jgi:hypothetical protein